MLSPSQYLTPDRGRGVSGLRDGLVSPRGPSQLFGGQRGSGLLRPDLGPEFTSTPGPGTLSSVTSPEFTGIQSPGPSVHQQPLYSPDMVSGQLQGGVTWATRAEMALSAPTLWQRCEDLKLTLENCPVKELSGIWQNIVDRIFMLGGGRGWGLTSVLRTQSPRDYSTLQTFLAANGPLLSAANRLLGDPYIRYEFPVSRLSQSIISQISSCSPSLSPFLSARLSPSMTQLSLNAFEYFMFSFSVLIVLPYSPDNKFEQGDSLYPYVFENYLTYYLPTDGTTPPSLPFQSPIHSGSPTHQQPQLSPDPVQASTPARKSLLRHPMTLTSANTSSVTSPTPRAPSSSSQSSDQVWRSESLLTIFSTAWLTQFSSQPGSPGSGMTVADLPFPKTDTLKIVRMLIKHLHYFSNSGGPHDVTPLDQLKRATLPGVKQRMYSLFKYVFNYWPHDTSFRIVLETWLSFIQPWRYTDRLMVAKDADPVPINPAKWQVWVAEHVLFFSEILRLLLPRFFRMDLTSSKNAYMLFRISKVFSQPGIAELIKNAESGLERSSRSQMMPSLLDGDSLSLDYDRELVLSAAKQCQVELEGHSSKCSPVFGNEFRQTVVELLGAAERAKEAAEEMLREAGEAKTEAAGGLVTWIQWLMTSMETSETSGEREELRRTLQHLNASMTGLGKVFSVAAASPASPGPGGELRSPRSPGGQANSPEMVDTDRGRVLTPHGRWQVVNGLARPVIKYEGDPDTRPITSREVVWIVRGLHQLSASLNGHYGIRVQSLYSEDSVRGQMARLVLAAPVNYYTMTKSLCGGPSTRELHHHPARISLRWLGDQMTLAYLLLYTGIMWLVGHSVPGSLAILLILVTIGVFITALARQVTQPKSSLLDTSDLILDSPKSSKDKKSD